MGVIGAIHLLNTVDIPFGGVRGTPTQDFDYTQWAVVKDLTNRKLYVRTYLEPNFQLIDPDQWSLEEGSPAQHIKVTNQLAS